ncbi:hypothetical protein C1H46_008787 [Malus baccata]|uniref:TSL-kinase interacting protein 1 n=1 Tax=Malus baccata TaxID=106549 RepID=A0A540N3R0_MALBA|nr:hypothetical protein C1H46_008787 [Malus baccata]
MKASRETNRKVIKIPIEGRARTGSTMREQRFTGRTTRVCHKATGQGGNFLVEMDENAQGMCLELPDIGVPFLGTIKRLPVLECYQGQKLLPQSKIKLQLFPVNEATRIGLEKMPDSMSSNRRWTLNDGNISAGAVYAAFGSPAVFRLSYGWFSTEPKTAYQPSTSANDLRSEGEQRCRSPATENVIDELWKHTALATKDFKSNDASETINADTEKISTGAVDSRDNIQRRMGNHAEEPLLIDSGKLNGSDAQPVESNAGLPPTQGQWPSTHDSCLSIFDAKETCRAFPSQKFSSSGKDVLGFGGSRGCFNQNPGSKLFKFPDAAKANSVTELPQDQRGCQESDTALMICSQVNNDERSLGLSGIKWLMVVILLLGTHSDSLRPFDLGLPVSRKLITGESASSIIGFVK